MPQSDPSISPGYDHATAWAEVVREHAEEETRRRKWRESNAKDGDAFTRSDSVSSMDVIEYQSKVVSTLGTKSGTSKLAPVETLPGSRRTSHDGSVDVFFDAKESIKPPKSKSWFGF